MLDEFDPAEEHEGTAGVDFANASEEQRRRNVFSRLFSGMTRFARHHTKAEARSLRDAAEKRKTAEAILLLAEIQHNLHDITACELTPVFQAASWRDRCRSLFQRAVTALSGASLIGLAARAISAAQDDIPARDTAAAAGPVSYRSFLREAIEAATEGVASIKAWKDTLPRVFSSAAINDNRRAVPVASFDLALT